MQRVDEILKRAGYFQERKEDVTHILYMYNECGYHCNNEQKMFIEKYAGLEIHYEHPMWKQDISLRINPIEAQREITMDVVEEYNDYLQDELLIIGDIEKENLTLFLSEKGFFITGYDDCLINWGNSFETMLSMLLNGEKGKLMIIE